MRRLLIIRHGESDWNRERRWQGWIDIALTPRGEAQARARGVELHADGHRFTAVHCSDLVRAARTAQLITEAMAGPPAEPDPALRERFGGEWQGLTGKEIRARFPDEHSAWRRGELSGPPGGETDAELVERVCAGIAAIDAATAEGPVLIVTHGGVLGQLTDHAGANGEREPISNLGGRWFEWDGSALRAGDALPPLAEEPEAALE